MNGLKTMTEGRLGYLDMLRGLGMIFIVVGHITYDTTVLSWLYSFHVPLFFFAAGAAYKKRPVIGDIKRRAQTVLVPYFSFGAVELVYWQFLERRFRPSQMSFGKSALGLLIGKYDYLDFNSHLWFLPCFFITAVFYNAMMNVGGKRLAYAVCAAMSVIFILIPMPEIFWGINRVYKYIGFYAAGNILSDIKAAEKLDKQKPAIKFSEMTLLLAASVALSFYGLVSGVMFFVAALAGIGCMYILSVGVGSCRPLQYIGRISLVILCIHGAVYRILLKLLSFALNTSTEDIRLRLYWVIPVAALTLLICAGAYEVIARTVPFVIGRKKERR